MKQNSLIIKMIILLFGLWVSLTAVNAHNNIKSTNKVPNVVVSIAPLYSWVSAVMGDLGTPKLLVTGNNSPHGYNLRPSDMNLLSKADVIFWVGEELEHFLIKPLANLGKSTKVVSLINTPNLLLLSPRSTGDFEHHHHHEHGHKHGNSEEHECTCDEEDGHGHKHKHGESEEHECLCDEEDGHGHKHKYGESEEHECLCDEEDGHGHKHKHGESEEHECLCEEEDGHGHKHKHGESEEHECLCDEEDGHGHKHKHGESEEHECLCDEEDGHGHKHKHGESEEHECLCEEEDGHGHKHSSIDSHFWLDPVNARISVLHIAKVLSAQDPKNAATYKKNAGIYIKKLETLEKNIAEKLSSIKDKPFVVEHDAYQYFSNRFNLNIVGAVMLDPSHGVGAKHLDEIRRKIKRLDAKCIFAEPQFSPKMIDSIAKDLGIKVAILDPLGANLPLNSSLYSSLLFGLSGSLLECLNIN
ncbi:metal ABC transporter solute-binding protein, Zn/Mn family [Bartonella sp. DGB1]|uniref:metal ABC transporter solute-binding protein, Zn/Mn family n=1 Tax=Bartonella sp. DGB1 TaxID=3239807 RepID=UPI0035257BBF